MASQPRRVQHLLAGVGDDGPRLYSFDANGGALDQPFAADGTGGQTAYGVLEAAYEEGIDRDAARRLAARAVRAATERDLASGNGLCLAVLDGSEPTVDRSTSTTAGPSPTSSRTRSPSTVTETATAGGSSESTVSCHSGPRFQIGRSSSPASWSADSETTAG